MSTMDHFYPKMKCVYVQIHQMMEKRREEGLPIDCENDLSHCKAESHSCTCRSSHFGEWKVVTWEYPATRVCRSKKFHYHVCSNINMASECCANRPNGTSGCGVAVATSAGASAFDSR